MLHEISQLDIPDRQLLKAGDQQRVSFSKEIGEATITHTIFGKAKVRIVRKHDNLRRALMQTVMIVAIAVAAWQAWLAYQPETLQSTDSLSSADEAVSDSLPPSKSEIVEAPPAVPAMQSKPIIPPASVGTKPAIIQKNALQPAPSLKAAVPVKPSAPQPLVASKPQPAPVVVNKPALLNQPNKVSQPGRMPANPPVPTGTAPRSSLPAIQPAASSPTAIAPVASPVGGEATPILPPAADKLLSSPISEPAQ